MNMKNDEQLFVAKLDDKASIPTYGTDKSAGLDLYSLEDIIIYPNEPTLIKTGISVKLPEGTVMKICSRSGLALKYGIIVLNAPGIIDEDYRGEIGVIILWNGSPSAYYNFPNTYITPNLRNNTKGGILIKAGTRIAQAVIQEVIRPRVIEVEEIKDDTDRGTGAFGSTGI
jgi:dUTP pyrophosphatase